jgi:hypothetical protein
MREDSLRNLAQDGIPPETDRPLGMDCVADLLLLWTRERVRHIRLRHKFQSVMGYVHSDLVPKPRKFSKLCLGLFANLSTLLYEPPNCTLAIYSIEHVDKQALRETVKMGGLDRQLVKGYYRTYINAGSLEEANRPLSKAARYDLWQDAGIDVFSDIDPRISFAAYLPFASALRIWLRLPQPVGWTFDTCLVSGNSQGQLHPTFGSRSSLLSD